MIGWLLFKRGMKMEFNILLLMCGVLIITLIMAGPTLYQQAYKKRHQK